MAREPYRLRSDRMYNLPEYLQLGGAGRFDIPVMSPCDAIPDDLIGFNYARTTQVSDLGIHFYIDDYQFQRVWNRPDDYLILLAGFQCVLTPDFSLYVDMPESMKIWNVYRSRLLGAYWQSHGLKVIPTLQWAGTESFDYCFDGIPTGSVVSASTLGVMNDSMAMTRWRIGMREALERLNPSCVLLYGNMMPGFDFGDTDVICYRNHNIGRFDSWAEEARARHQAEEAKAKAKSVAVVDPSPK